MGRNRQTPAAPSPTLKAVGSDLAEIALAAGSASEYRRASLARIGRALSADAVVLNHTRTGFHIDVGAVGVDEGDLGPVLPIYLNQVSPPELERALAQRGLRDEQIFATARRQRLRIYREYLRPRGFSTFALCGRIADDGVFWISIMRAGRDAHYDAKDLQWLEALFPIVAAGDLLHRPSSAALDGMRRQAERWLAEGFVTPDQCNLMELLERGLTVSDLCRLLGEEQDIMRRRIADVVGALRGRLEGGLLVIAGAHPSFDPHAGAVADRGLSRRAAQTLHLLRQGLSDKEIATQLGLSRYTVNQYTKTIYGHFGVHSRSSLIAQLLRARA